MTTKPLPILPLFGLPITTASLKEISQYLADHLESSQRARQTLKVFTPNPEQVVQAHQDDDLAKILQSGDVLIPDGVGLVVASKLLKIIGKIPKDLPRRVAGRDLVKELLGRAKNHSWKILIVGGRGYSSASESLASNQTAPNGPTQDGSDPNNVALLNYNGLTLYWTPGYDDVSQPTPQEQELLSHQIARIKPDIIFVAFGAPAQEKWIYRRRQLLAQAGVGVVMSVGGSFDVLLGKLSASPEIVNKLGLEWLFRLAHEPWRWRRQLRLIQFVGVVVGEIWTSTTRSLLGK